MRSDLIIDFTKNTKIDQYANKSLQRMAYSPR